jgi:hypothetical protein
LGKTKKSVKYSKLPEEQAIEDPQTDAADALLNLTAIPKSAHKIPES